MTRTKNQIESDRAKKRAKTGDKEKASDSDSGSSSDSSSGAVSLIDSDDDKPTTKSSSTVQVISKGDPAWKSSSNKGSPLPRDSPNSASGRISLRKNDTQFFIALSGITTYEEILKELNQQLLQHDFDDNDAVKKLLNKHLERLENAGNGTYEAGGNASARLSKSGNVMKRYTELLCFDNGKYKLIQKSLKTITAMAGAHDSYVLKVKSTVTKLKSALQNLTDQIEAFKSDTAANAKSVPPSGKGVLTSVNDRLEKLLNKQDHLQTSMSVLLEHKPYEDELLENIQLTKKYISERTAQSEKDISLKEETLQAQIVTLQGEVSAKDAVILSQTESVATLTATYAEVTSNMVVASVQGHVAKEVAPPPRQILSPSQQKQNRIDRIEIIAKHQDNEYAKFEDSKQASSPGFRKFKKLLRTSMEASMRMSWNQHALDKVWTILMPDYPFDDTAFTHFHIRPGKDVSKPYNAITSPNIKHGYGTVSGDLPGKDDSPGKAMSAVVQQFRFLLENMKHTKDECTLLCVQKNNKDAPTTKLLQGVRWFSSSTGFIPVPYDKSHEFIGKPPPTDYKNARHTQLRTQIRLFIGWDFDNKKPIYESTDAIWYLYFVEKLTKRFYDGFSESIQMKEESSMAKYTEQSPDSVRANTMLRFQLPIEFFFFDEAQSATTDSTDPRLLRVARKGYTALLKLMDNETGPIYGTIMSVGASFFEAKFNDPNASYPLQKCLKALLKPQDCRWHIENNFPPAHMHKSMREKWSKMEIKSLKKSQVNHAESKWAEYFILNLNILQSHGNMALEQYTASGNYSTSGANNFNSKYTPLQNTPLVQAAFANWPTTTFEALVAEASAIN